MTMLIFETRSWALLRGMLGESRVFRGDTGVRLKDLNDLFVGHEKRPGLTGRPADPNGGLAKGKGEYTFDPSIFSGWEESEGPALARAATDKAGSNHVGAPVGAHGVRKNYGGTVSFPAGKPKTDFERLPSSMDRYDVLMVGELVPKRDRKTGEVVKDPRTGRPAMQGILYQVAYTPSMGDHEARRGRLMDLMAGKVAPPPRRPQGEVPGPSNQDTKRWADQKAKKDAADLAASSPDTGGDDDRSPFAGDGAGAYSSGFRDRMAKHNAEYRPQGRPPAPEDDDGGLFGDLIPHSKRPIGRK